MKDWKQLTSDSKEKDEVIMNNLQVFENKEFGEIRTLQEDGNIWFCGADVCRALGFVKSATQVIQMHCKTPGVLKRYIGVQTGLKKDGSPATQKVSMIYINEPNLYRLIIHSRLPAAEKFEKWVFEEVLPAIRQNGCYGYPSKATSVGEIVNLIKVTRETMQEQGKTPEEIAATVKDIGQQFGIRLTNWLVAPEKVTMDDVDEAIDYIYDSISQGKRRPKFENFLIHVSVQRLEGGKGE